MREQGPAPKSLLQRCPVHGSVCHKTKQAAEVALAGHVGAAKDSGVEGKAWKRLNVYRCRETETWHVGHAKEKLPDWRKARQERRAAQQPKPLTPGQLRRKIEHAEKERARHTERAAYFAEQIENLKYADYLWAREVAATAKASKPGPR